MPCWTMWFARFAWFAWFANKTNPTKYEEQCEIVTFYTEVLPRKVQNWEEKPQINFFFQPKIQCRN